MPRRLTIQRDFNRKRLDPGFPILAGTITSKEIFYLR